MPGILVPSMQTRATVSVRYSVPVTPAAWVLPEGTVPESPVHHLIAHRLTLLLEAWAARREQPTRVLRNLAVRWLEEYPRTGIDPDVCVLAPPPPNLEDEGSLCLWKPGHLPPPICFEIVSENHPYKDYALIQDRYAAFGARELVVFDPLLAGPRSLGGAGPLQLWRRDETGALERVHFSGAPAHSDVLDAWLIPDGRELHLADDPEGRQRWLTEAERAKAEAERERERREELERRLRELEKHRN